MLGTYWVNNIVPWAMYTYLYLTFVVSLPFLVRHA